MSSIGSQLSDRGYWADGIEILGPKILEVELPPPMPWIGILLAWIAVDSSVSELDTIPLDP